MVKKKRQSRLVVLLAILLFVVIILAIIIFTNLNVGTQPVQGGVPGVATGDVFTYNIMGIVNAKSAAAAAEVPSQFLDLNNTEWYRVTVTDVSGSDVSIATIQHFKNGTEVTGTGTVNVDTGINSPVYGFWTIFASNLKANDRLRPNGPDRSWVNTTTTRDYGAGVIRNTDTWSIVTQYVNSENPDKTYTEYGNTYFDQQTGMLVELRYISVYNDPQVTTQLVWKLAETNRWEIS
jgi:hypothetical protein